MRKKPTVREVEEHFRSYHSLICDATLHINCNNIITLDKYHILQSLSELARSKCNSYCSPSIIFRYRCKGYNTYFITLEGFVYRYIVEKI